MANPNLMEWSSNQCVVFSLNVNADLYSQLTYSGQLQTKELLLMIWILKETTSSCCSIVQKQPSSLVSSKVSLYPSVYVMSIRYMDLLGNKKNSLGALFEVLEKAKVLSLKL